MAKKNEENYPKKFYFCLETQDWYETLEDVEEWCDMDEEYNFLVYERIGKQRVMDKSVFEIGKIEPLVKE